MKIIRLTLIQSLLLAAILFTDLNISAQTQLQPAINWLTFEQVAAMHKDAPKPLMVYFYKAGNDSSELMLSTTFTRKEVCAYTNQKFYPVKIEIGTKEDITFMDGKTYKKDPTKPYHDLVTLLLGNKTDIPVTLLYDDQNKGFRFNGFRQYQDMLCMLLYISENVQKTTKYEYWAPAYFRTFPPEKQVNHIPMAINWLSLKDALIKNKENPKGIFLTFFMKNNAASTVMLVNAFSHSKVAEYLQNNFYCVRIDAQTTDTLVWDKQYINKHESGNYHEMALTFMNQRMQFPSVFFFDKSNKLILTENHYFSPEALYLLSNYVVSESYKSKAFADFIKTFKYEFNDIIPGQYTTPEPIIK